MIRGVLTIDQTPCRASYGILTPTASRQETDAFQKMAVANNIGEVVANGDRLAKFWSKANSIEEISAEAYGYHPKDVVLKSVERPVIRWYPDNGNRVDIFA